MSNDTPLIEFPRDEGRAVRRDRIIDAAIDLFAQRPFDEIGIRDVAAAAGLSAASMYRYFSDKNDLFVAALAREIDRIVHGFEHALHRRSRMSIKTIAQGFIDYLSTHDTFFQMMTHFMGSGRLAPSVQARFDKTMRSFVDALETAFRKQGAQEEARLYAHAFFAALNGILVTFRHYPGRNLGDIRQRMQRLASVTAELFEQAISGARHQPS
mgnify:FL=1